MREQEGIEYRVIKLSPQHHYRVGSDGTVWYRRTLGGDWFLKEHVDYNYGRVVDLETLGGVGIIRVGQLVLEAFGQYATPENRALCFRDGDKFNVTLANVFWGTGQIQKEINRRQVLARRRRLLKYRAKARRTDISRIRWMATARGKTAQETSDTLRIELAAVLAVLSPPPSPSEAQNLQDLN